MAPKTIKSYLKLCLDIANANRDDLKGVDKITHAEYLRLGDIRAEIQNELCYMEELLKKYNLKYNSNPF